MNRKIKFRAWSKSTSMVNIDDNSSIVLMFNKISGWNIIPNKPEYKGEYLLGESQSKTPDFVLMQFTGLHDKNGREIYEGDVVNINEAKRNYVVKFHKGCFKLFHADPKLNDMLWGTIERVSELLWSLEIIGNVYENPELLKN